MVLLQSVGGRDVVSGRQQVTRIETKANRQVGHLLAVFANHVQLFEPASQLRARAYGIFHQQHQLPKRQSRSSGGHSFKKMENPLLHGSAFVIAGMRDHVIGADSDGARQLASKRFDRKRACAFVN